MLTKLVEKEVSGPAFPVSDKGLVKVEAAINGVVVDVLCDPGSYHNLCSPEVAKDLNLIFDGVTKAFSELGRDVGERTKTVDLIIEGFNPTNVNFYVCPKLQLPVVVGMEALGAIGSQINCVTRKLEQAALPVISPQIGPKSRSSVQKDLANAEERISNIQCGLKKESEDLKNLLREFQETWLEPKPGLCNS
eukprot:GHVP01064126.1.p1 GENE.GHVP01064126.1~~GHVP01064126.1.p1  ORF type:complete len:192 (-),score=29.34 GHVP01064126.1:840-1415(-)